MNGYYELPLAQDKIHLVGPMMNPTSEGHLCRLTLMTLSKIFSKVSCYQPPPYKNFGTLEDDPYTRLVEELWQPVFPDKALLVSIGSSNGSAQKYRVGNTNIYLSTTSQLNEEFLKANKFAYKALHVLQGPSWYEWWENEYLQLEQQIKDEDQGAQDPVLKTMRLNLKEEYNLMLLDSEENLLPTDKIIELAKAFDKKHPRLILYAPSYNHEALYQELQKSFDKDKVQIDMIVNWLPIEDRIRLANHVKDNAQVYDSGGLKNIVAQKGKPPRDLIQTVAMATKDLLGMDLSKMNYKTVKRVGFVCDYVPGEHMCESALVMNFLMASLNSGKTLYVPEWISREVDPEDCCLDYIFFFQPQLLYKEKVAKLLKSEAKKIFICLEMPAKAGEWSKELMENSDLVIFRSPLQNIQYHDKGIFTTSNGIEHPLMALQGLKKEHPMPQKIGIIDGSIGESFSLQGRVDKSVVLVSNIDIVTDEGVKTVPWEDHLNGIMFEDWIISCEEFFDYSSEQSAFNTPLAHAILTGKKYSSQLFHGCLSYQNLLQACKSNEHIQAIESL